MHIIYVYNMDIDYIYNIDFIYIIQIVYIIQIIYIYTRPFKLDNSSSEQTVSVLNAPCGCKSPFRDIPGEHPKYGQTINNTIFFCTDREREREKKLDIYIHVYGCQVVPSYPTIHLPLDPSIRLCTNIHMCVIVAFECS